MGTALLVIGLSFSVFVLTFWAVSREGRKHREYRNYDGINTNDGENKHPSSQD